jgi:hypothetical protein
MANPFDQFDAAPQPATAPQPMTVGTPRPKTPPAQTAAQAENDRLQNEKLRRELAKTPETDPALSQSIKNLGLDEWLTNVDRARTQIDTGFATGVLGSLAGHFPGTPRKDFLGALQGIKGASILEKLQALREQSKTGASGMGSLTEQEGERLANSIASLSPDMSADELRTSLDIVERHARALKAIGAGKDPGDPAVQKEFGIKPLPGEKGEDKGITQSAPLPLILGEPEQAPSTSEKAVLNPKVAAIAPQLTDYLNADPKRVSNAMILGFVRKNGIDPKEWPELQDALSKRGSVRFQVDPHFSQPLSAVESARSALAQTAPAAAGVNFVNGATAGNFANIAHALGGDRQAVERGLDVASQEHPVASLAGSIAGGGAAALSGEAALAKLGMNPGLLRGLIADSVYGTTAGATNSDDPLSGGLKGLLLGAGGSLGGNAVARGLGATLKGVTNPTVSYVARELPGSLTLGQAVGQSGVVGRAIKGIEDRLSGIPVVGDAVNARRIQGMQKMNAKAFDRALEPIKGSAGGKFGEEAVADAQDQVSAAFQNALNGKSAAVDTDFITQAATAKRAIQALPPSVAKDVENHIDTAIGDYFDPATLTISGENMQGLLRDLQQVKRSYQNEPAGHRIGRAIDQVTESVENLFRRQEPSVMPAYDAAKKAFKRLSTLEDAVLRAKQTGGVFSPAQLGMADRASTVKFGGKHAAAAGKGEFHDFQRNMQEVLPNKVPDSGTAGRAAVLLAPTALSGAGAGIGAASGDAQGGATTGLTLGTLLALAYSRGGQRALIAAALKRPNAARAVGSAVRRAAPLVGHGVVAPVVLGSPGE